MRKTMMLVQIMLTPGCVTRIQALKQQGYQAGLQYSNCGMEPKSRLTFKILLLPPQPFTNVHFVTRGYLVITYDVMYVYKIEFKDAKGAKTKINFWGC